MDNEAHKEPVQRRRGDSSTSMIKFPAVHNDQKIETTQIPQTTSSGGSGHSTITLNPKTKGILTHSAMRARSQAKDRNNKFCSHKAPVLVRLPETGS